MFFFYSQYNYYLFVANKSSISRLNKISTFINKQKYLANVNNAKDMIIEEIVTKLATK